MVSGPMYPDPRRKRIYLHKGRTRLHRQKNLWVTVGDKVAVEDAGAVEDTGKIRAIRRAIDQLRITHPPTSGKLLTKTKS
jgi:hypothetical protein